MRRYLLFFVVFIFCSLVSKGQTRIPREIHVGFIGGANLSEYTFQPKVSQRFNTGYTGGVAVRYIEETLFGLQAEFLLTQRYFRDDYREKYPELEFKRELLYLEIPVMAHVYFKVGDHHEVAFDAGPKIGWFLSDKVGGNLPDDFGQAGSQYPEWDVIAHHSKPLGERKLDYGIQAGLGYEFKFNRKVSMQLQGRYYYGLANLWADTKADEFQISNNQSIQIVMSLWWHHTIKGKKVKL